MYDRQREAMQVVDAYGCLQQDIELGVRRHLWVFLQTRGQAEGVELGGEERRGGKGVLDLYPKKLRKVRVTKLPQQKAVVGEAIPELVLGEDANV